MPAFSTISVVARDPAASIAFYRVLGLDLEDHSGDEGDIVHITVRGTKPADLDIDSQNLAELYNAGARTGRSRGVVLGVSVESRREVDDLYAALTAAGHEGLQPPWDAFWGARYAVVADPDGNDVGLMSPIDDDRRTWPPAESPGP